MLFSSLFLHPQSFPYQIKEKLGEGLNACVYKAIKAHPLDGPSQVVALKILKSKTCVEKWRKEFQTLSSISSPYCVSVLGWEILNSKLSLVLKWVEGLTLRDFFLMERVSKEELLYLCWQIDQGLRDLRRAGSYHGDLSPLNVLISTSGQIKLIDFGLSFLKTSFHSSFQVTKDFAAPEVLRGQRPDYFSDLYSLGKLMTFLVLNASGSSKDQDLSFLKSCLYFEAQRRRGIFFPQDRERLKKTLSEKIQILLRKRQVCSRPTFMLSKERKFVSKRGRNYRSFLKALKNFLLFPFLMNLLFPLFLIKTAGNKQKSSGSLLLFSGIWSVFFCFVVQGSSPMFFDFSSNEKKAFLPLVWNSKDFSFKKGAKLHSKNAKLIISTHYWFQIFINGTYRGYTPLSLQGLRSGVFLIEGKREKYKVSRLLRVGEGEVVVLNDSFFGLDPSFP